MRLRPLVVYVTGIHVARAESRIFVTSAPSQVHSEEIPVFSFEAQSCKEAIIFIKLYGPPTLESLCPVLES